MRVLLSAYIGSPNLGDEAIASVLIDWLNRQPAIDLTVLSLKPAQTRRLLGQRRTRILHQNWSQLYRQLKPADALVMGGGGIIQDESSVLNLLFFYLQVLLARRWRKPVYWLFVGVGPIHSRLGRLLTRHLGRLVTHALVRDVESAQLLQQLGWTADRITTGYDLAFNLPDRRPVAAAKEPYVLFCPRDWFFTQRLLPTKQALRVAKLRPDSNLYRYRQQLAKLASAILQTHPRLIVRGVPFYATQDTELLNWLGSRLPKDLKARWQVVPAGLLPADFNSLAHGAKLIIGSRLHSLILGAVARRPLVALVYTHKVGSLVKYLRLGDFATNLERPDFDWQKTLQQIQQQLRHPVAPDATQLQAIRATNRQAYESVLAIMKAANPS